MANITLIQSKINKGYSIVAKILGDTYSWYRPDQALVPIANESYLGDVLAQFAVDPFFKFFKPVDFPTAERWYGTFQQQVNVQAGDYFIGRSGTYYVVFIERLVAIMCIWCNRTLSVGRAQDGLLLGAQSEYSGQSIQNLVPVMSNWPGSLRQLGSGMKMRGTEMKLPSDAPLGAYGIFIPYISTAVLQWNDVITDDLGRRYAISSLEQTALGWRISAEMWPT